MRDLVKERLPIFSEEEKKMIKGTMDFIGIDYYTSAYAANAPPPKQYPSHSVDSLSTTNCKLDISYLYIYRILTNKQQSNSCFVVIIAATRNGVPIGPLVRNL